MSGAFPTTPLPDTVTVRSIAPTLISVAHSLQTQRRSRGGQRFAFDLEFRALKTDQDAPLRAFLMAQRGQYEAFQWTLIGHLARGTWSGAPQADGAQAAGLRSVALKGFSASQTGVAKAGDYLRFNGHTKLYMVTADASSNGAGQATLTIEPALMAPVANNEPVLSASIPVTVRLGADTTEYGVRAGYLYSRQLTLVEEA